MGEMWEQGDGVVLVSMTTGVLQQDLAEAVRLYRAAADQGHAVGQGNLGRMYEHGAGVQQDFERAADCYRRAALQGVPAAFVALGGMYERGQGLEVDAAMAASLYQAAADAGFVQAQKCLARMYAHAPLASLLLLCINGDDAAGTSTAQASSRTSGRR